MEKNNKKNTSSQLTPKVDNDQLGENASGMDRQDEESRRIILVMKRRSKAIKVK